MRLVTPEQMREMDRRTIEEIGLPGIVLMERAALGAVDLLREWAGEELERVGILCGGGNNGGDGIAMARMLDRDGVESSLVFLSSPSSIEGDAGINLAAARQLDLPMYDLSSSEPGDIRTELEDLPTCDVWVDALLGTGLTGDVRGRYAPAIEFLNTRERVFAVDIPSGVHGGTGQEMGVAVDADVTATFGDAKLGQALYPGRERCGRLHVVDIGVPDSVRDEVGVAAAGLDFDWARARLPARPRVYHKGKSGRVLAVAGSREKTGAALLCASGALAGGAGLVTVGTTAEVVPRIAPAIHEVMAECLVASPSDDSASDDSIPQQLAEFIDEADCVAAGPGLGTGANALEAVRTILESDADRAVFDADALNLIAGQLGDDTLEAFARDSLAILTPHPGEMSRLCGCSIDRVLATPVECTSNYARDVEAIVVLKMAATVVATPDGRVAVNRSGNPGLATGGTGDVLTGIVAARLAESTGDPFTDVCLAVWAHGRSGDRAARRRGERGLRATDLPEALPTVWSEIESDRR